MFVLFRTFTSILTLIKWGTKYSSLEIAFKPNYRDEKKTKTKKKNYLTKQRINHQQMKCETQNSTIEGKCLCWLKQSYWKTKQRMDDVMHGVLGMLNVDCTLIVAGSCCLYWSLACLVNASTRTHWCVY